MSRLRGSAVSAISPSLGDDYIIPNQNFQILSEQTQVQVNLTIIDDTIPEDRETANLRVEATFMGVAFSPYVLFPNVMILDNDG